MRPQLLLTLQRIRAYLSSDWRGLRGAIADWATVLFGLFAARGATALTLVIVARKVLPIEYGQYLSCFGLTSFLVVLPNCGLDVWLLTRGRSTPAAVTELWCSSIRSRIQLLSIWIVGMMLLGLFLPADTFPFKIMLPTALGVACDSLVLLSYAAFRSLDRHGLVMILQSISSLALLGITLVLPLESGHIALFAIGRTALSAVSAVIVIAVMGKDYLRQPTAFIPTWDLLLSARPYMVAELASSVYVKADLTIVSLLLGSSQVSVYGPALNLLQVSFLVPRALFFFVVPVLSRTYVKARRSFKKKSVAQFVAQAVAGAALSVGIFLLAPVVINFVFGPAYESSAAILRLLSPIPFLRSLNFALGAMLASSNRQSQRTRVQLLCAVFNVLANLVVISPFGVAGVAVVYTLSELILFLGYLLSVYNWVGTRLQRGVSV
jgi:O-antigen/teichoic acid export membrane protein